MTKSQISIQDRSKNFAIRIIKACSWLDETPGIKRTLGKQLLRSGTSIGANCKEAVSAQSRRDFVHKYEIALKEAQETEYWLEILIESETIDEKKFSQLLSESREIIKILSSSVKKLKQN
ncbi:MAG: hypothetical protein RLZZ381_1014 [Cyanobacteriota bacterium]|jgi:four helix bundle protein